MAVNLPPLGELLPVPGVRLGMACAGIKQRRRDDLAIIELAEGSTVAGVFTQNRFRAPPVALAEARIQSGNPRLLLINSGNANAATGQRGFEDAEALCSRAAECCGNGIAAEQVLPFSTGVIGERLPMAAMSEAIAAAATARSAEGWAAAAAAIMTTDTAPKALSESVLVARAPVTITGIAKGAGMIKPDMATMLAFVCCDAKVRQPALAELTRHAAARSFNRITVDGDTSTNDAFVVCATSKADHPVINGPGAGLRRSAGWPFQGRRRTGPTHHPGRRRRHQVRHRPGGRRRQRSRVPAGGLRLGRIPLGQNRRIRRGPQLGPLLHGHRPRWHRRPEPSRSVRQAGRGAGGAGRPISA